MNVLILLASGYFPDILTLCETNTWNIFEKVRLNEKQQRLEKTYMLLE